MLKKLLVIYLLIGFAQVAIADDDDEHEGVFGNFFSDLFSHSNERPAKDSNLASKTSTQSGKLYQNECSACHFAYQANLLPSRSWEKLMQPSELENHFGDNAEVDEDVRQEILLYLVKESENNRALIRYPKDGVPMRITSLRKFQREHDELPKRMVQDNPKVKSFSNCVACHTGASRGDYSERGVRIPGFGYWED